MGNPVQNAQAYLESKLEEILDGSTAPALAAALVREGQVAVFAARGVRKSDVSETAAANIIKQADRFCLGSVSKPVTGYLITRLVQERALSWTSTIQDVFTEFKDPSARKKYNILDSFLTVTVEQLMSHSSGLLYAPTNGYDMAFGGSGNEIPGYTSASSVMRRRYQYAVAAMQDTPAFAPLADTLYGGGCIICAAMAERKLGKAYEALVEDLLFQPLGMANAGVGRLATTSTPDGTWQHSWNKTTLDITPSSFQTTAAYSWHSHNPAGAVHFSAADLAAFLKANMSFHNSPKVVVKNPHLQQAQMVDVASGTAGRFTRGGWASNGLSTDDRKIWHNGDNGVSYANMEILPKRNWGCAAMSNLSDPTFTVQSPGKKAVSDIMAVMRDMNKNWDTLFNT